MKVEYSKEGLPEVIISSRSILSAKKPNTVVPDKGTKTEYTPVILGSYSYVPAGDDNNLFNDANTQINQNTVLTRSIQMLSQIILGQGIFPCIVTGFNADGSEILEQIDDKEIIAFVDSNFVRNYLKEAIRDILKFGNAFVQFRPTTDGKKIFKFNVVNCMHCRLEAPKNNKVNNVLVDGLFPAGDAKNVQAYQLLDYYDALEDLKLLQETGRLTKSVFYHIRNLQSNEKFYTEPEWYSTWEQGYINISNKIATFINSGYDNALNSYIHIQIPYAYFELKYPLDQFNNDKAKRKAAIDADLQKLEEKMIGVENAKKTLITYFGSVDGMPDADKWHIDIKEFKFNPEQLQNSTAADSQIALGVGLHPDIMGLMYGNSKGGSMQREILLLLYALSYDLRQRLLDPLEMVLKFNFGNKADGLQLRFRQTFLTTLDNNSGTSQTLA